MRAVLAGLAGWLPSGHRLSDAEWQRRHRVMLWVIWPHVPLLWLLGARSGQGVGHVSAEVGVVLIGALLASARDFGRRWRTLAAVLTLVGCSSILVHFTGGLIESHFHFFAVVAFITLYQEWTSFAIAFCYVVVHHALTGIARPEAVYNHEAALARPVLWAAIHGGFVALASFANLAAWRLAEVERTNAERVLDATGDGLYGIDLEGRIVFANPVLRDLLDRPAEQLIGADHHRALGHRLASSAPVARSHCPLCTVIGADDATVAVEAVLERPDGTGLPVECIARPLHERGRREGAVITVRDLRERRSFEEELRQQALRDPLTGLANRALLSDHLRLAFAGLDRDGRRVGVLFCDLNRFKLLNDSLGHTAGDQVLRMVGDRLRSLMRRGDTVARFGGDEFVVLCPAASGEAELHAVAGRILTALREPFQLDGRSIPVGVSIGISSTDDGGGDPSELLRDADAALYRAKSAGQDVAVFDESLRADTVTRFQTETDLHEAIARDQLELHYQPIIALDEDGLAAEALVRWRHPVDGLLPPAKFIPVAEEAGLISRIDAWVLDRACRQLASWDESGLGQRLSYVSVNVSGRQLTRPGWPDEVERTLERHGLAPERLCLEVTESAVIHDLPSAVEALGRLQALGTRVALDDFGTGYSSLNYLRQLPVTVLKIDRSFVTGLTGNDANQSVVTGIVSLARAFGLLTVAEGVEDPDDLAAIRDLHCDHAQGFLWGRPCPADEFAALQGSWATLTAHAAVPSALRGA